MYLEALLSILITVESKPVPCSLPCQNTAPKRLASTIVCYDLPLTESGDLGRPSGQLIDGME